MTDTIDNNTILSLTKGLALNEEPTSLETKLRALFTPMEAQEDFPIDARELHDFLGIGKDFSNWIKDGIKKYDFVEEVDYNKFSPNLAKTPEGGRPTIDYKITLDMAKELSMVQRTDLGKLVRRYLIWAEQELQKKFAPKPMSLIEMFSLQLKIYEEQDKRIRSLEISSEQQFKNLKDIKNIITNPSSAWNQKISDHGKQIEDHEQRIKTIEAFGEDKGPAEEVRILISDAKILFADMSYEELWTSFYEMLRRNYGIDINRRFSLLKKRRLKQGWSESKVKDISKLDTITANPDIWKTIRIAIQATRTRWMENEKEGSSNV